jgi:hypothetical protein
MNCEKLTFVPELRDRRLAQAKAIMGEKVTQKLLAFALFLLGATRNSIAAYLSMPEGTLRSLIFAIYKRGLPAIEDQRSKTSSFKLPPPTITPRREKPGTCVGGKIELPGFTIELPDKNKVQQRIVLLTLLQNDVLKLKEVAVLLNLSEDRTMKLVHKLRREDVTGILDQRRGQQKEYLFTPQIKSEIIQQFVLDIVSQGKISGELLAQHLRERCSLELSPRSILYHISAMGLPQLKNSLSNYLESLKKKSATS